MASTYGYITAAALESFTGIDYSAVDAAAYTDARVEAVITTAEEMINSLLGVSTAQTVTNAISIGTKFIAAWLMHQSMSNLGYTTETANAIYILTWQQILDLVREFLENDATVGIDTIPMSGANRYYSFNNSGFWI